MVHTFNIVIGVDDLHNMEPDDLRLKLMDTLESLGDLEVMECLASEYAGNGEK